MIFHHCRSLACERTFYCLAIFLSFVVFCFPTSAQEIVDDWKYTLRKPADGWQEIGFDDANWQEGHGGFGTRNTPGARVGTTWATNSIWLRKTFKLNSVPENPVLWMHHDEDVEVFINGNPVAAAKGFASNYAAFPMDIEKRKALKAGTNLLAVHCKQTQGGQFIDVHLIDGDKVPNLPAPKRDTKPFQSDLITKWGAKVTAENAWTEYPRPQLQREQWQNLNGHWDYDITPIEQTDIPKAWSGKILVPYCLESKLGGVKRLLDATEALWYHRRFNCQKSATHRQRLNFEAVDYRCEVFVNGTSVGKHQGGNSPFSLDITDAINEGTNELVVRVEDETEGFQLNGKQSLNPRGIWYTQVSGIWQTVWLEQVHNSHLVDVKIQTDAKTGTITVVPQIENSAGADSVKLVIIDGGTVIATQTCKVQSATHDLVTTIENAKLWTPSSPHLYPLQISLLDDKGNVIDQAESYAGIRDVGKAKDPNGHWRFTLNDDVLFHWGPLDQGWWPDGLLTPPSDEAMSFDIQWLKNAGFNMIRKHIKVESRRYYYHCDRLGMMVWQDQVSGGPRPKWTRLQRDPSDADWPDKQHQQFMLEFERMIDALENHPSIVVWTPFNEAWGQHRTMEVGRWTAKRDPSRLVNIASGGNFWPIGDIVDHHQYPHPGFPFDLGKGGRFQDYVKVVGEFGGHGYPVKEHLWDVNRNNWGYGGLPQNETEYKDRYVTSLEMLDTLRRQGIAAGVYTQTTDVEGEINGLMTYDRKVVKIPSKDLAKLHQRLFTTVAETDASRFPNPAFIQQKPNRKP